MKAKGFLLKCLMDSNKKKSPEIKKHTLWFKTFSSSLLKISGQENGGLWNEAIKVGSLSFCWKKVISICYVDDLLFWAKAKKSIHDLAMKLRIVGIDLE